MVEQVKHSSNAMQIMLGKNVQALSQRVLLNFSLVMVAKHQNQDREKIIESCPC